jgi:SOS-response transcriptional repressor LexA
MCESQKATGFPSPAQGYEAKSIDLNALLVKNPSATYFMRSESRDMAHKGVFPGSVLVVDRSVAPVRGSLAVIAHEGCFMCREFAVRGGRAVFTDGERDIDAKNGGVIVFGTVTAAVNLL